jgi:hypothetical protein
MYVCMNYIAVSTLWTLTPPDNWDPWLRIYDSHSCEETKVQSLSVSGDPDSSNRLGQGDLSPETSVWGLAASVA